MNNLPRETSNYIYQKRALCILYDRVSQYNLNFNRLCDFLIRFKGVIGGSFILSCFDNTIEPNDLDIFVQVPEYNTENVNMKAEFFKLVNKPITVIGLDNQPLSNSSEETDTTNRVMKFYGFGEKQMNKIDLVMIDEEIQQKNYDIVCSSILFNGTNWIFPTYIEYDIEKFILLKHSDMNPYKTYFSEIYDPWKYNTVSCLMEDLSRFKLSRDVSKIVPMMRPIFDHLINFYPDENKSQTVSLKDLAAMQSLSAKPVIHTGGDLTQNYDTVCPECSDISDLMCDIKDKYLPRGYQPYFVDCKHQYFAVYRCAAAGNWQNQEDSSDDFPELHSEIIPHQTVPIKTTSKKLSYAQALRNDLLIDDHPSNNKINWQISIDVDSFDQKIKYCPQNLINVTHSIFPDTVIKPLIMNQINLEKFIKIFTIYKFWYRVLKYISRGYTIFGILDTLKIIINDNTLQLNQ